MDKISIARGFTFSVRLFKWKAQQKLCFTYCDLDRIDSFGLNMKRRQYVSIYIFVQFHWFSLALSGMTNMPLVRFSSTN